jgi:PAS domain S-box-containing protein
MREFESSQKPIIELPPSQFAKAFPFHIAVNHRLEILQLGQSLKKVCPETKPLQPLKEVFKIIRPDFELCAESLLSLKNEFFLLEHPAIGLKLRGEFVALEDSAVFLFLGSPWLTDISEIEKLGLDFGDFATHDPAVDLLQVFQANHLALQDAKNLASLLTVQREELEKANQRLKTQEAETRKLAQIVSRTTNAVVITDASGMIIWVNDGFVRLTEFTLAEAAGKTPGSFLQGPETDPATVRFMRERITAGKGYNVEIINYSKSGRKYWLEIDVQPILDDYNRVVYYMAIESNVTERKNSERILRESIALQRTMIDGAGNAIIGTDTKGIIRIFNPAAEQMLGYSAEEVVNKMTPEAFHVAEEIKHRAAELSRDLIREIPYGFEVFITKPRMGQNEQREWHYVRKDNSRFPVLLTVSALHDEQTGNVTGYLGLAIDLSERKQFEAKLKNTLIALAHERDRANLMASKADSANRAKSDFLASMSHEIRTPLNIILGNTQLLNQEHAQSDEIKGKIRSINRAGEHLLAILNNILDLAKIDAGQVSVNPENFNLLVMVKDVLLLFSQTCSAKNIELQLKTVDLFNPTIYADQGKIRQILVNILGNAVKFTNHGDVTVIVQHHPATPGKLASLTFQIRDSGPGINPGESHHIFEEFGQTSIGRKFSGGAGLGLAISRKYARLLGGDITFQSSPGHGTEFLFTIPIETATVSDAVIRPLMELNPQWLKTAANHRILIVDDLADNREFLNEAVRKAGFQVHTVSSGPTAINETEIWNPHLILMDIRMPEMNGIEAIQRIRQGRHEGLKIIAVSALAYNEDKEHARAAGADAFIPKPIKISDLIRSISELLSLPLPMEWRGAPENQEQNPSMESPARAAFALATEHWRQQFRDAIIVADFAKASRMLPDLNLNNQALLNYLNGLLTDFQQEELMRLVD